MTPSAKQKAVSERAPAWAAILIAVFSGVLWFNGRLATVEANYGHIKDSLKEIKDDVKSLHPMGSE